LPDDSDQNNTLCAMAPESDKKKDPRAWDALTPALTEWILDAIAAMGFGKMTPVQASSIPLFLKNKDVVVEVMIAD
jgi:ATP-dependent RNA helicase DDX55/SPB4